MNAIEVNGTLVCACAMAEDEYISKVLEYYEALPEFEYSDNFEKKIRKLCRRMKSGTYKKISKPFRALLIAAILTTILSLSAIAVPPTREIIRNYKVKTNYSYSFLKFDDDKDTYGTLYSEYTYIPEGYTLCEHLKKDSFEMFQYEDGEGHELTFRAIKSSTASCIVDTEGGEIEEIPLHGVTAFFVHCKDMYYIHWGQGEYNYSIIADDTGVSKEEFINIAKGRENLK